MMLVVLSVKIAIMLARVFLWVLLCHPILFFRSRGNFIEVSSRLTTKAMERGGMISGGNGGFG